MSGRVLVTGAAGFIGSSLVDRLLAEGRQVTGIDCLTDYYDPQAKRANLSAALGNDRFAFREEDLLEADLEPLLDDCDTVYHLAAQAGVRASWGREFDIYLRQNLAATQKLLEALKGGKAHLVYASSSSIYGRADSLPTSEDDLPRPFSPYGVTKLAAEQLCGLYRENHGLSAVALRFFTVYGPRQRPDMAFARFITDAEAGRPLSIFGDGEQTRDFTFVDDIVDALRLAAVYRGNLFEFNVAGGSRVSLTEALDSLASALGFTPELVHVEKQRGDVPDTWGCTARIKEELGFTPSVDLAEGLTRQVAWSREGDRIHEA